ncbi:hypothetical protein Agub_g862, partial [Astrephomene gubernaculifera]
TSYLLLSQQHSSPGGWPLEEEEEEAAAAAAAAGAAFASAAGTSQHSVENGDSMLKDAKPWMRNADGAGTVTHLAPECFVQGSKLDQSVDVYAFGIVMWEVFTRKPPYAEFAPDFE